MGKRLELVYTCEERLLPNDPNNETCGEVFHQYSPTASLAMVEILFSSDELFEFVYYIF